MKKRNPAFTALTTLLLCISLAGCGSSGGRTGITRSLSQADTASSYDSYDSYNSYDGGYTMAKSTSAMNSAPMEEAYYDEDTLEFEEDMGYGASASASASGLMPDEAGYEEAPSPAGDETDPISTEKLVYTGNLTVETTAFSSTLDRIKQSITDMGGFIESEDDSDDAYGWYMDGYRKSSSSLHSYIQARIPSARFYEFLDGIEGEGAKVMSRSVNVQNISRQYSETATSIESYQIQERRLLDMMENATRVSDMLEIESRLSEVQGYLKQYQNALSGMDTDVAYSTVIISIREVGIYTQPEATTFGEKISEAFSDGLQSFADGVQALCIWFAGHFLGLIVFILVILLIAAVIKRIVRRIVRRMKMEKASRETAVVTVHVDQEDDMGADSQMPPKDL